MKFIMFTKHLEGYDIPQIMATLKSVGVEGADLCVRDGYPVNPDNIDTALPEAARMFATLAKHKINIQSISTSEIKISCLIDEKQADTAVKALCEEFKLVKDSK